MTGARTIPPPPVWGVTSFVAGGRPVTWTVGRQEMEADIAAAVAWWPRLGLRRGDGVLFVSMLSEAPHVWPMLIAALVHGTKMSPADATRSDAQRVAMFCRSLRLDGVLGVGPETLAGLAERGLDPAEVLGGGRVVAARPGAYEALAAAGLRPQRYLPLGPCLAIGLQPGGAALVDPARWTVSRQDGGEITVTAMTERHDRFVDLPTGVHGTVDRIDVDGAEWWAVTPEPSGAGGGSA